MAPNYHLSDKDALEIHEALLTAAKIGVCYDIVGYKCNLHCEFCNLGKRPDSLFENRQLHKIELNHEIFERRLDIMAKLGITTLVTSSWVEIFAYRYWREYLSYASSKGFNISLLTNGVALTRDTCRFLAELGIKFVNVSLNALTAGTHMMIAGHNNPELFETADASPWILREYGIGSQISFVWTERNNHEVEPFIHKWTQAGFTVLLYKEIPSSALEDVGFGHAETRMKFPANMCASLSRKNLYVSPSGHMYPCCYFYLFDDDRNSFGLPVWMLDDNAEQNIHAMFQSLFADKFLPEICRRCSAFSPCAPKFPVKAFGCQGYGVSERQSFFSGIQQDVAAPKSVAIPEDVVEPKSVAIPAGVWGYLKELNHKRLARRRIGKKARWRI
jgi:radical SAM protein with 4Fe4S-binding SPASM domain